MSSPESGNGKTDETESGRLGGEFMRPLKSIEEAAGLLGISKWTVRAYIKAGKLRPVRLGRRVLVREEELERLILEGQDQCVQKLKLPIGEDCEVRS